MAHTWELRFVKKKREKRFIINREHSCVHLLGDNEIPPLSEQARFSLPSSF